MGLVEQIIARGKEARRRALEEFGRRSVLFMQDMVSVPVTRTGGVVIRSEPGEPPYMEHGDLFRGFRYRIEDQGQSISDLVITNVDNPRKVRALEKGTLDGRLDPRPFMGPGYREINRIAKSELGRLFREYFR